MADLVCSNGHQMLDGDAYCGACGGPAAVAPEQAPPADEQEAGASCPNGHTNPPGHSFCGTCGVPLVVPSDAPSTSRTDQRSVRLGRRKIAIGVLVLLAIGGAVGAFLASRPSPDTDVARQAPTPTTTAPETPAQRAQRLFQQECQSRFAVKIDVRPSRLLPGTASGSTTAYFFEIYSHDTGAYLARGVWTDYNGREGYNCNQ